MAQKHPMGGDFLPKPIRLKRISATCVSPSDWIDVSIQPGYSGSKSTCKRVDTRHFSHDESVYEGQLSVSPTSSPEFDYLGSGHEFLGIEVDEHQSTPAIPSSLHISDSGSCCSSQRSTTATEICSSSQPSGKPAVPLCDRDSEDFEYLNLLQRNEVTPLYLNLCQKLTRQKEMKSGLTSRISLLARRSYSERSMWLHRHTLLNDYAPALHTSRIFRVSRFDANRPSGLPGLLSFKATELFSNEATEHLSADTRTVSSILLPVSGGKLQFGASILGDNISHNDAIRVYSPWSASTDPSDPHSPVLHSFFWVERMKSTELANCIGTTPRSEPPQTARISLICQCFSASNTDFSSCCYRFRSADDAIENVFETPFALDTLKNPIIVLATSPLWLTQKIRQSLVVLHHTLGLGVIVMPATWNPVATTASNTDSPMQARTHLSDDIKLGGLYSVENLFQLTSSQLPQGFHDDAYCYFADTRRLLCGSSSRRLSHFVNNWDSLVSSDSSTNNPCCLWDARIASFRLVRASYLRIPEPLQFSVNLPLFSRCHLDGLLLSEIPAGSLLFSDVIQRLRSLSILNTSSASDDACRLTRSLRQAARLFFLSITDRGAASTTIVPCICLYNVPSPLNLIRNSCTKKPYYWHLLPSSYGFRLTVTNAYTGPGCVFVDFLASIRMQNRKPLSQSSRFNMPASNVYTPLDSAAEVTSLQLHDLVQLSGTIVSVDTNRSHTWPVCALCFSDDLKLTGAQQLENDTCCSANTKLLSKCSIFQCGLCGSQAGDTLHSCELEVLVALDTVKDVTLARPHVLLIMSPVRLFKILGLPGNALAKDLQLNPKLMLSKRIERVAGLVVRVKDHHPLSDRSLPVARVSILDLGLEALEK